MNIQQNYSFDMESNTQKKQMYMTQNTELLMCKVTHKLVDQNNEKSGW